MTRSWEAGSVGGGESASVGENSVGCAKVGRVGKSAQESYRELQLNGSRSIFDEPLVKNVSISSCVSALGRAPSRTSVTRSTKTCHDVLLSAQRTGG